MHILKNQKIEPCVLKQDVSYSLEKPEHVHTELEVDVDNDQFLQARWKLKMVVRQEIKQILEEKLY